MVIKSVYWSLRYEVSILKNSLSLYHTKIQGFLKGISKSTLYFYS